MDLEPIRIAFPRDTAAPFCFLAPTAAAAYTLKSGFSTYRYRQHNGEVATARSVTASNLTCSISQNDRSLESK
jgi:hypothetical protein